MESQQLLKLIRERRSVREFLPDPVDETQIIKILEAGRWAPSGKNNQPWRFIVVRQAQLRYELAKLTIYGDIIRSAPVLIAVFMDRDSSYDHLKDSMAIGACIQNMLLYIHSSGLGGVWLGEILKNKHRVAELLMAPQSWELMAIIALGYPSPSTRRSSRKPIHELAHMERYGAPIQA